MGFHRSKELRLLHLKEGATLSLTLNQRTLDRVDLASRSTLTLTVGAGVHLSDIIGEASVATLTIQQSSSLAETPVSLSIEQLVVNALSVDRLITIDLLGSVQITRLVFGDADTTGYLFIVTRPDSRLTIGTVSSRAWTTPRAISTRTTRPLSRTYRSRRARQVSSTTRRSGLSTNGGGQRVPLLIGAPGCREHCRV